MNSATYLVHTIELFHYYKNLGEKAINQLNEEEIQWQKNEDSNSIAIIIKHLAGNMRSRWTDFLTSDGEKTWRNRDGEFVNHFTTREELMQQWEDGWACLLAALEPLKSTDMDKIVYIRGEPHTIIDAINRQLAHYAYHIGQIVYLAKMHKAADWKSLSVPRNKSTNFDQADFLDPER